MKRLITPLLLALIAFALVTWYRKTGDAAPLTDTLIIGTSSDFPPFSTRDTDNTIVGFDIDVVKEVAKRLDMKTVIEDKPFGTLLPQLELGQVHIIAAGMSATPEREKRVTFTKPYLNGNPLLIVTPANQPAVTGLADLKDKEVIVNTGYVADIYLSKLPDIKLVRLTKVADALAALDQGKATAFVTATFALDPYVKENKERYNYFRLMETDENTALALSKHLPQSFVEKVQQALDAMQADGTLDALKKKWALV